MLSKKKSTNLPLIYSCSGCSNVAQLANDIAVKVNLEGLAEMSCIAGIGGNVKPLVKKAKEGRSIIVIDGCALKCAKACLTAIGIQPNEHITLTDYHLKKENNTKIYLENEMDIFNEVKDKIQKL
ncbi:MAG: putative zinc-binding protein [Lutibacter sp.]|nr:putative zinc-binding protein [Lutibacter sp.]